MKTFCKRMNPVETNKKKEGTHKLFTFFALGANSHIKTIGTPGGVFRLIKCSLRSANTAKTVPMLKKHRVLQ